MVVAPTGDQYEFRGGGYRAVVTESGATLRLLEFDGRPLLDGFADDELPRVGRGQVLAPWPNRIRDGRYTFEAQELQLALSEPRRGNASHGLVRWASWSVEEHTAHSVSLVYRLMAQTGYPWTLDLHVVYDLSADGLTVTTTATNLTDRSAPWAYGAHPYLCPGTPVEDGVDTWELTLPAATRVLVDDRMIPTGSEPVSDTDYDFRVTRPVRRTAFDSAFTDLDRNDEGHAVVEVRDPATRQGVSLWMDAKHPVVQIYSGDDAGDLARRSLAVEPMSAPANAFVSGEHLVTLGPAGTATQEWSASWGIRALSG